MNVEKVFNTNRLRVIGTLVEVDLDVKASQSGQDYIGGTITVKSDIDGAEQLTELRLFSFKFKKGTTVTSKLFESYNSLENWIGKRVEVSGSIDEGRFFDAGSAQVVSFNNNGGRFINKAKATDADCATFEYAGFVVKPLTERLNKEENIVAYEMMIGQANYNGTKPIYVKFTIPAEESAKAAAVQNLYEVGDTVVIEGNVSVVTEEVVKEMPTAFGEEMKKTYINTYKTYQIVSGSEPVEGKGKYSREDVIEMANAYKAEGAEIESKAKDSADTSNSKSSKSNAFGSLL